MTDYNEAQRKQTLREMSEYVDSMDERRERAIEALGTKYLLHPANRVQRRTVPYGSAR
ncbi:hypothetical protein SAMN05443245_5192 [Paraburkholderia fungorum]|uniref:Uncharacterized protein n=1 Tax=Paraburkholderia fungorum TaxID=134537 RepID=A0A1H1IHM8_9BURK|nr:hypothetical protein [Paraburkholderia fungorum]SDR37170.1 hypothetical protein SAMN05443245_5192 [Paraburkholderia fungorum]